MTPRSVPGSSDEQAAYFGLTRAYAVKLGKEAKVTGTLDAKLKTNSRLNKNGTFSLAALP
jgi:hypothetical protein